MGRPKQTYCQKGHDLAIVGKIDSDGKRRCAICRNVRARSFTAKRKAEGRPLHQTAAAKRAKAKYRRTHKAEIMIADKEYRSRPETKEKSKQWRKISSRRAHLKKKFSLTLEEFDRLVFAQDGKCKICQIRPNGNLRIDHDHATGRIRSLLCHNCNVVLGLVYEDIKILKEMINYLNVQKC